MHSQYQHTHKHKNPLTVSMHSLYPHTHRRRNTWRTVTQCTAYTSANTHLTVPQCSSYTAHTHTHTPQPPAITVKYLRRGEEMKRRGEERGGGLCNHPSLLLTHVQQEYDPGEPCGYSISTHTHSHTHTHTHTHTHIHIHTQRY